MPRFNDQGSRAAVLSVLAALLVHDQQALGVANGTPVKKGIAGGLIKWIEGEVDKVSKAGTGTVAAGTRAALLGWTVTVFASLKGRSQTVEDSQWNSILASLSTLFDSLVDESITKKLSIRKSAVVAVRRIIRNVSPVLRSKVIDRSSRLWTYRDM